MEEVNVPPFTGFIEHGYAQPAGPAWEGSHWLRYHAYIVPQGVN